MDRTWPGSRMTQRLSWAIASLSPSPGLWSPFQIQFVLSLGLWGHMEFPPAVPQQP